MSASAEQMSAQVEEVVASAQNLSDMSRSLQQAVSVFKVDEGTVTMANGSAPKDSPAVDEEMAMSH